MHTIVGHRWPVGAAADRLDALTDSLGGRDHYMNWLETSKSGPEVWGSEDHKKRERFRSRMTEIAGGVCQAVTECGGWFDFGTGGRGGMSEVLKDGLKAHWAAKSHLAGFKSDTVVLAVRLLESAEFHGVSAASLPFTLRSLQTSCSPPQHVAYD